METAKKSHVISGLYAPSETDIRKYENYSICILTPCAGYTNSARFTKSVANMVAYSWMNGLRIYQMGITERMVVDWGRNELARTVKDKINEYTDEKFTHLLWLDDDHTFNPDLACALMRHDKDMVGALYFARVGKPLPVVYVCGEEEYMHYPLIIAPNALFRCDAIGFGALLMRRNVLDRVPEPWFTLDWKCGEDLAFCISARKYGIEIYCDGQYKLGHIGAPPVVTEKDYLEHIEKYSAEYADKIKVQL